MKTPTKLNTVQNPVPATVNTLICIDLNNPYSVHHVFAPDGAELAKGRIERHSPGDFAGLVKRWAQPRVVFECSLNYPSYLGLCCPASCRCCRSLGMAAVVAFRVT